VEVPEESLAHNHRRAGRNHVPIRLALPNVPERHLLPIVCEQFVPDIGPSSQRSFRDLVRINRYLPVSWNEKNPDFPRTAGSGQEQNPSAEDFETASTSIDLAAQGC